MSDISPLIENSPISETIVDRLYPSFINVFKSSCWVIESPILRFSEFSLKNLYSGNFSVRTLTGAITISGLEIRISICF